MINEKKNNDSNNDESGYSNEICEFYQCVLDNTPKALGRVEDSWEWSYYQSVDIFY